jgi:hypothetical protein
LQWSWKKTPFLVGNCKNLYRDSGDVAIAKAFMVNLTLEQLYLASIKIHSNGGLLWL